MLSLCLLAYFFNDNDSVAEYLSYIMVYVLFGVTVSIMVLTLSSAYEWKSVIYNSNKT
jgi:hypothetical protein